MDIDIQLGDLEEAQPDVHLRPDRNRHYSVVAYETPTEEDLPIFIELDVLRDMETHALSDTDVELGGVMLGGQFLDEDGKPFVFVTDSLRAQHFEATKGSFKFTHDTWAEISRQRDEFPDELQMVGWYHTHPDWGVFLSGMDMFICDNFFNRDLDLALVIDPCRQDRGMFQWTGDPRDRIRRTGGFYVTASRFRQHELELFAAQLESGSTMPHDPRFAGIAGQIGPSPAPVVNIADQRNAWHGPAIMGMLSMQFLMLLLIAWRLFTPAAAPDEDGEKKVAKQLETIENKVEAINADRNLAIQAEVEFEIQSRVLSRIVGAINGDGTLADQVAEQERRLLRLESENRAYLALESSWVGERKALDRSIASRTEEAEKWKGDYERSKKVRADDKKKHETEIAKLEEKIKAATGEESVADDETLADKWLKNPVLIGISSAVLLLTVVAIGALVWNRRQLTFKDDFDNSPSDFGKPPEEPRGQTNNENEPESPSAD